MRARVYCFCAWRSHDAILQMIHSYTIDYKKYTNLIACKVSREEIAAKER